MKKAIITGVILLILIGVSAMAYAYRSPLYAQLDAWKLIPKQEHFTELYFVTYPTLAPSNVPIDPTLPF